MRVGVAGLCSFALLATSSAAQVRFLEGAELAEAQIEVKNDDLDTVIKLNSSAVNKPELDPSIGHYEDVYLRSWIDKKTGKATYQAYFFTIYSDDWAFFNSVNYLTPDGPATHDLVQIDRSVVTCVSRPCSLSETVGFDLDEATLNFIASRSAEQPWRFRLNSKSGREHYQDLPATEAAAMIAKVKQQRAALALPAPSKPRG